MLKVNKFLELHRYTREYSIARVLRKRRNSREMASDAPWVVSFKCIVKGYQDCRFEVKEGEDQSFKENKRAGARKAVQVFRIINERGQLDHLTGDPSPGYDLLKNYLVFLLSRFLGD